MPKFVLDNGIIKQWKPAPGGARVVSTGTKSTQSVLNNLKKLERIKTTEYYKICIQRKLGGFGDILMITPSLKAIRIKYPKSHITLALPNDLNGQYLDLVKHNPYIDEIVPWPSVKVADFDVFVDVTQVCLSFEKAHSHPPSRIDLFAQSIGVELKDKQPIYIITESERKWASELKKRWNLPTKFGPNNETIYIGVQMKSQAEKRSWPIENIKNIIGMITYHMPNSVVVLFTGQEALPKWKIKNCIELRGYQWRESAAIVDSMDLMVTMDSGLLHLAAALNKKTVAIFGSTPSQSRSALYPHVTAIEENNLACRPCWYGKCDFQFACLKQITPSQVFNTIKDVLNNKTIKPKRLAAVNTNAVLIHRDVGGYGDMITLTPIIREFKKQNPKKKLFIAVPDKYKCVFEHNPHIDGLFNNKNNMPRTDRIYNLSAPCSYYEVTRLRQGLPVDKSRIEIFAETCDLGILSNYKTELFITEEEKEWAQRKLNPTNIHIGISLRTSDGYRDWPIHYFNDLFNYLDTIYDSEYGDSNLRIILFDHERNFEFNRHYIIDGMGYPFRKMVALAQMCDLLVTLDTALLHIAGSTDIPTIALFGPIDSKCRTKHYKNVHVLYDKNLKCLPCWRNNSIPCVIAPEGSDINKSVCMENITAKQVFNKIIELI